MKYYKTEKDHLFAKLKFRLRIVRSRLSEFSLQVREADLLETIRNAETLADRMEKKIPRYISEATSMFDLISISNVLDRRLDEFEKLYKTMPEILVYSIGADGFDFSTYYETSAEQIYWHDLEEDDKEEPDEEDKEDDDFENPF